MRPAPIRTDATNQFAHFSMKVRVPKILDEVIERNPDFPQPIKDAIARLRDGIAGDMVLPGLGYPAPDAPEWEAGLARRAGETWLASDWFFVECYVYRCLATATRYFETRRDPFGPAKDEELASDRPWRAVDEALVLAAGDPCEHARELLTHVLWGNRVDLSYAVGTSFGERGTVSDLLVDDRDWAAEKLTAPEGEIHIVADNAGTELAMDLILADFAITQARASVTVHVKMHPMFVSDAMVEDVWHLLGVMRRRGALARRLAARLEGAFERGQLRIATDFFWTGPQFLWELPGRIARGIESASFVVVKGDANYRRSIGDAIWPEGVTYGQAADYWTVPAVCLRTMKSDALVGVDQAMLRELDRVDPTWRINGRRGVIQGNRDRVSP